MSKPRTTPAPTTLELPFLLAELPSSQHRAGLAGLVLTIHELERRRSRPPGILELVDLRPAGVTLRVDQPGLATLFDTIYKAERVPREVDKPFPKTEPDGERQFEELDAKGKLKLRTKYIYNLVRPDGACQRSWDLQDTPAVEGMWVKLWRDMVWNILRGVPAQREPFNDRADHKPPRDVAGVWDSLQRPGATIPLPSTYFLGAQAVTAENVDFTDLARDQLLLHFWSFAAPIYVPRLVTIGPDGAPKYEFDDYVLAIPDIGDLVRYCEILPDMLRARTTERTGYRPREAVVDLPAESALSALVALRAQLRVRHARADIVDVIHGVDAFHVGKDGNNVRIRHVVRVDPVGPLLDEYDQIHRALWNPLFRRQLLGNRLAGRPWHSGFDRLLTTTPWKHVLGDSHYFAHDARTAPTLFPDAAMTTEDPTTEPTTTASMIYSMVRTYLSRKLARKHDLEWDAVKDDPRRKADYNDKKEHLAREAFLAIRSRTGDDFVEYFTATLCSVPHYIPEDRFVHIAHKLHDGDGRDELRTLTLLALSAHGSAPKSKEAKEPA